MTVAKETPITENSIKPYKSTFLLKGSNNSRLENIINEIEEKYDVKISKTAIFNQAVNEFLNELEKKDLETQLIKHEIL